MDYHDLRDQQSGELYEQIGLREFYKMPPYWYKYKNSGSITVSQMGCIIGLIKAYKFSNGKGIENILEVGTNIGLTDVYVLKTGVKFRKTFDLYSLDKWKNTNICGRLTKDLCTENELLHWHFFPGKTTFDIEDIIGGVKLDAVFIDGAHAHPYPLLDLLFLLPYLHEESLIIFHDVNNYPFIGELGACYIFSAWPPMYRYLNFYVDNPNIEPITQEYMGVCTLPSREQLLEILLSVAMFPIDAPWEKYGSWKNPLGLEPNDMQCH